MQDPVFQRGRCLEWRWPPDNQALNLTLDRGTAVVVNQRPSCTTEATVWTCPAIRGLWLMRGNRLCLLYVVGAKQLRAVRRQLQRHNLAIDGNGGRCVWAGMGLGSALYWSLWLIYRSHHHPHTSRRTCATGTGRFKPPRHASASWCAWYAARGHSMSPCMAATKSSSSPARNFAVSRAFAPAKHWSRRYKPRRTAISTLNPSAYRCPCGTWACDGLAARYERPVRTASSPARAASGGIRRSTTARSPVCQRRHSGRNPLRHRTRYRRKPPRRAERMADSQASAHVRGASSSRQRRHHVRVAAPGRRGPQVRPYVFAAGPHHCRNGAASWTDGGHTWHRRPCQGAGSAIRPVARLRIVLVTRTLFISFTVKTFARLTLSTTNGFSRLA